MDETKGPKHLTEDMSPHLGRRVFAYWNIHHKVFSVRHQGKVIAHVKDLHLKDVKFRVSEAGRQRVIASGHKNVHGGVEGTVAEPSDLPKHASRISYNPYMKPTGNETKGHFYEADNPNKPAIHDAARAHLQVHEGTDPNGHQVRFPKVHAVKNTPGSIRKARIDEHREAERLKSGRRTPEQIEQAKQVDRRGRNVRPGEFVGWRPAAHVRGEPRSHDPLDHGMDRQRYGSRVLRNGTHPYKGQLPEGHSRSHPEAVGTNAAHGSLQDENAVKKTSKTDKMIVRQTRAYEAKHGHTPPRPEADIKQEARGQRHYRGHDVRGEVNPRLHGDPEYHPSGDPHNMLSVRPDNYAARGAGRSRIAGPKKPLPKGHDRSHPDSAGTNVGGIPGDTVAKAGVKKFGQFSPLRWKTSNPAKWGHGYEAHGVETGSSKGEYFIHHSRYGSGYSDEHHVRFYPDNASNIDEFQRVSSGHKDLASAKKSATAHAIAQHHGLKRHEVRAVNKAWPEGVHRFVGAHPGQVRADVDRAIAAFPVRDPMAKAEAIEPAKPLEWKAREGSGHEAAGLDTIEEALTPHGTYMRVKPKKPSSAYYYPKGVFGTPHYLDENAKSGPYRTHHHEKAANIANDHHAITHYGLSDADVAAAEAAWPGEGPRRFIGKHPGIVRADLARAHQSMVKSKRQRFVSIQKAEKGELDKAIKDIPVGKQSRRTAAKDVYDYSHVLKPEHRAAGYSIEVHHSPNVSIRAELSQKGKKVGEVFSAVNSRRSDPDSEPKRYIEPHSHVAKEHRGQGLGVASYEALYAHAAHSGITYVRGGPHSTEAGHVHEALARKHGLKYNPDKTPGIFDRDAYRYVLKTKD